MDGAQDRVEAIAESRRRARTGSGCRARAPMAAPGAPPQERRARKGLVHGSLVRSQQSVKKKREAPRSFFDRSVDVCLAAMVLKGGEGKDRKEEVMVMTELLQLVVAASARSTMATSPKQETVLRYQNQIRSFV